MVQISSWKRLPNIQKCRCRDGLISVKGLMVSCEITQLCSTQRRLERGKLAKPLQNLPMSGLYYYLLVTQYNVSDDMLLRITRSALNGQYGDITGTPPPGIPEC